MHSEQQKLASQANSYQLPYIQQRQHQLKLEGLNQFYHSLYYYIQAGWGQLVQRGNNNFSVHIALLKNVSNIFFN